MPSGSVPKVLLHSPETSLEGTPQFTPASTPRPEARESSSYNMPETTAESSNEPGNENAIVVKEADEKLQSENKENAQVSSSSSGTRKSRPKCRHGAKQQKDKKSRKKKSDQKDSDDSDSSDSSDSSSDSDSEASASSSSSDSPSEDESAKKKSKRGKKSRKDSKKSKKSRRRDDSSSENSGSESGSEESESESDRRSKKKSKKHRGKKRRRDHPETSESEHEEEEDPVEKAREYLKSLGVKAKNIKIDVSQTKDSSDDESDDDRKSKRRKRSKKRNGKKKGSKMPAYFRGDELWDTDNHQYELKATKNRTRSDKAGEYVFTVKRHFDWEGKYEYTDVWIHANPLRECLQKVMENCKSVSLAEEEPVLEPDTLFLYLEDMRKYRKDLKAAIAAQKLKKKVRKALETKVAQLKCMIKYLDKDYASTKATLYPMLEQGTITFDLLWTLFRSDTVVYTTAYGNESEPRAYKVDYCNKESSFTKGVWYEVMGKYFDFDGKDFGLGSFQTDIDSFRGVRKISSLSVYPIQYHPKYEKVRDDLVERGKKFVSLAGMKYKFLKGMGFMKRRGQIVKISVNGRIMCDPATFRRINPNYPISNVKREDPDLLSECESDSDDGARGDVPDDRPDDCNCADCLANDPNAFAQRREGDAEPKKRWKRVYDCKTKQYDYTLVPVDDNGVEIRNVNQPTSSVNRELESLRSVKTGEEGDDKEDDDAPEQDMFTDEELLIASPVILGFSFGEKMWLELSVSGIQDISWNEGAFDSLVLPAAQKDIIKALVTAHSQEAKLENKIEAKGDVEGKVAASSQNIDDVIQGKGKGLVSVLHGTPGTGKTLTAEGIAELLKCPLYCVSAGELGTNPRDLEAELTKILDVAHAWGAVLLLDEADVFLEARTAQDIHRNALVSIFLRLLEYFQGILFLTTNRVASFDEAFQSRIHIALRYQELDFKARRKVWAMFISKVRGLQNAKVDDFGKDDLDRLARKDHLNGRQIKNAVRSAQALALNEQVNLSMKHIEKVLDVAESFERDLKGGSGYADAMRSYT